MGHDRERQTGKFYGIKSGGKSNLILPEGLEDQIEKEKTIKDMEEAGKLFIAAEEAKQKELELKLRDLEILPMFDKIIVLPYPINPYKKLVQNGIIVEYNGVFKNPDSGEFDKLEQGIICGKVIEVGPDTKYLRINDDVFYSERTVVPLPFFNQGYFVTHETGIIAVANKNLKERFGMNG